MRTLLERAEIHARLQEIFPAGAPQRGYLTRMLAASTVYTALYVGAVEDEGGWLGPKHVYRMTDLQAAKTSEETRQAYAAGILKPGGFVDGARWYQDNTREPIRDETLREGLVFVGAVIERSDLPTTSSKPRYALGSGFADLFAPYLSGEALDAAIAAWQAGHMSAGALARLAIVRGGAGADNESVLLQFPNGETRRMSRPFGACLSAPITPVLVCRRRGGSDLRFTVGGHIQLGLSLSHSISDPLTNSRERPRHSLCTDPNRLREIQVSVVRLLTQPVDLSARETGQLGDLADLDQTVSIGLRRRCLGGECHGGCSG
jgi:hypothetical protein